MQCDVQYTFHDLWDFQKYHIQHNKLYWFFRFFALFTLLSGLFNIITNTVEVYTFISIFLGFCFLIPEYTMSALYLYINFHRNKSQRKLNHITINENEIAVKTDVASLQHSWKGILKYHINEKRLVLYVAPKMALLIPRRCFPAPEDWEKLSQLVKEKVQLKTS